MTLWAVLGAEHTFRFGSCHGTNPFILSKARRVNKVYRSVNVPGCVAWGEEAGRVITHPLLHLFVRGVMLMAGFVGGSGVDWMKWALAVGGMSCPWP